MCGAACGAAERRERPAQLPLPLQPAADAGRAGFAARARPDPAGLGRWAGSLMNGGSVPVLLAMQTACRVRGARATHGPRTGPPHDDTAAALVSVPWCTAQRLGGTSFAKIGATMADPQGLRPGGRTCWRSRRGPEHVQSGLSWRARRRQDAAAQLMAPRSPSIGLRD